MATVVVQIDVAVDERREIIDIDDSWSPFLQNMTILVQ